MMVLAKGLALLRKYILTIPRFDLFLQGALLIVIFLESYVYLLIRRNAGTGLLLSINEDWVKIGVGGAEFLLGSLVAWYGRGTRHFALAGWLAATAISGLIVLAFPYPASGRPSVELCEGGKISTYSDVTIEPIDHYLGVRTGFLVLTAVLCALTKISVWAHGVTYLDDHEPESGTYFYGILISIRLSVGLSSRNWLRNVSVTEDWWEAHISLSMLTLMFAILFTLFPHKMKGYKDFEEVEYNCVLAPIGRMLRNKALMLQVVALILLNTAVFGYVNFDPASIQAKFYVETIQQDPRTARTVVDIFRSLVIIFFVSLLLLENFKSIPDYKSLECEDMGPVVDLKEFQVCHTPRDWTDYIYYIIGLEVLVLVLLISKVSYDYWVFKTAGYLPWPANKMPRLPCDWLCECKSESYGFSPVCLLNTSTTYFSPCHAGCREYEDLNGILLLSECSCGAGRAVRGACALPSCWLLYNLYLVFFTLVLATSAASLLMQGMAVLRAVPRRDKAIAIGVSFALVGLFSNSIGHLLYMGIGYLTCGYQVGSSCLLHHFSVWSVGATSAGLSVMSGAVSILASRASRSS